MQVISSILHIGNVKFDDLNGSSKKDYIKSIKKDDLESEKSLNSFCQVIFNIFLM